MYAPSGAHPSAQRAAPLCREVIHGQFHVRRDTPRFPKRKYPAQAADAAGAPPAQVALPLAFHGGPSSLPLVKAGERVYAGQPIARPEGEDGAVLHASVSGRVEAIRELPTPGAAAPPATVIANDGDNTPWPERPEGIKLSQASQEELMVRIEAAGIVDMGSDPLPAQVKILRARGRVDTLIVNAAECEPYITARPAPAPGAGGAHSEGDPRSCQGAGCGPGGAGRRRATCSPPWRRWSAASAASGAGWS